jgi:hypothetical protein
MTFRFAPGGRSELFDLADWYDAQLAGLGARLSTEFDNILRRILVTPRIYGRVARAPSGREVRVAPVRPFLVLMTYEVTPTEVIIIPVNHARSIRQPWRRRLP